MTMMIALGKMIKKCIVLKDDLSRPQNVQQKWKLWLFPTTGILQKF